MDIGLLKGCLVDAVDVLQFVLETASVICVLAGFARTLYVGIRIWRHPDARPKIKLVFGRWLSMALEFQLAADILVTTVDPDLEGLIKLSVIALIRTFLNYFLMKEIEAQDKYPDKPDSNGKPVCKPSIFPE